MIDKIDGILKECKYKTTRSSGAGGQHVNKVETKVTILFNIHNSKILSQEQKEILKSKLLKRISKTGIIQLSSQKYKSQLKNKKNVEDKLLYLILNTLKVKKIRRKTKIPKEIKENRLKIKRINSDKKQNRKKIQY